MSEPQPLPPEQIKALDHIREGMTNVDVAKVCGVSRGTIVRWKQRWTKAGIDFSEEAADNAEGKTRKLVAHARQAAMELRKTELHNVGVTAALIRSKVFEAAQQIDTTELAKNPRGIRDLAVTYGIMVDKAEVLANPLGSSPEQTDADAGDPSKMSDEELIDKMKGALVERGVTSLDEARARKQGTA